MSTTYSWPPAWIKVSDQELTAKAKDEIVKSEFWNYISQPDRKPSIIKNALNDGALKEWSFENISAAVGNTDFDVYVSASGNFPGGHGDIFDGKERVKSSMTGNELIQRINTASKSVRKPILNENERYYLYQADDTHFQPLLKKLPHSPVWLLPASTKYFTNMWISSADSLTPAHYDKADNLLLQLHGKKSVLLWDPSQLAQLSLQSESADQDRQTTINMRDENSVKSHEEFMKISAMHCILNPGDVLYLPEGWIHAVYSLEASVSVNYWWSPIQPQPKPTEEISVIGNTKMPRPAKISAFTSTYTVVQKEAIEVPAEITLTKQFVTLENARRRRFHRVVEGTTQDKEEKIIPCQACGNKEHEYSQCPYLGHYEWHSICGQTCNYETYRLKKGGKDCSVM